MEHEKSLNLISRLNDVLSASSPEVGKLAEAMIEALELSQAKEQKTMEAEKHGPCWVHNLCPVKIPLNLTIPGIDGAVLPVGSLVGDPARGELKLELAGADPIIRIKPGEAWRALAFDALKEAASRIVLGTPTTPQPEPEKQPEPAPEEARFLRIEQALQALEQQIQAIEEHVFDMDSFEMNDAEEEYEDTEEDGHQGVLFG